ncbi:MAG TPA: nicotinate phosphoribosyltransferase [Caldilineaceae bacterium]|nr:nicotinate phosphoribosyltransferase [Caldilineaceae bacterium]
MSNTARTTHDKQQSDRSGMEGILFTDQYQLTMAQLYFRAGMHETNVQFDHFYRRNPNYDSHQAGYCVNAGLAWLLDWMADAHFRPEDIDYLRSQTDSIGQRLFADDFLSWLAQYGNFDGITLRAIPEGRVVHPNMPLTVIEGPLIMAQILETSLLAHLNYQILIATKAARLWESGRGRPILEFGLRRGHERGGNAGARAALIGGASFTSNVGVSRALGLPPKGTHAHSMVQLFMAMGLGELAAFQAYADLYPDDCLLLVDTIDTLQSGVPHAIRVFETLKAKGHKPVGIRLDSGDLAYLSIQAAKLLNEAGFEDVSIVLSSDLDELVIWQIVTQISQEAPRYGLDADHLIGRLIYGVGTRLITSWGEPALGGVYKLVAVQEGDHWNSAIKVSETPAKTPNPGRKRIWRLYDRRDKATADLLTLDDEDPRLFTEILLHHPSDHTKTRLLRKADLKAIEPLLVTVLQQGKQLYTLPSLEEIRQQRIADVERLDPGIRRLVNPHIYHVSLTPNLWDLKQSLITEAMEERER